MKIKDHFMRTVKKINKRIEIITNGGEPTPIPRAWRKSLLGSCNILVAIPDMHMYIRKSKLDNFHYGMEALQNFLTYLNTLKEELALKNKTLRIYQLGDVYEMRFPSIAEPGSNATASEIRRSHPDYDLTLSMMDHLRTHFLYGNHDFELRHFPSFRLGAYEGKVYLEHGFTPSPWYENPRKTFWEPAMWMFKKLREVEEFFANLVVPASQIGKDKHFGIGVTSGETERGDYPPEFDYPVGIRDYYSGRVLNDPDQKECRACIIGHTHQPYLKLEVDAEGGGYVFADAGGWTEGRSDFVVMTNEEIAICHYKRV